MTNFTQAVKDCPTDEENTTAENLAVSEGFRRIAHTLKSAQAMRNPKNNALDRLMWYRDNPCNSPAMFAGQFAIATGHGVNGQIPFSDAAANIVAAECGFDHHSQLTDWACNNPELWGNHNGSVMFISPAAFQSHKNPTLDGDISIDVVYRHFYSAADLTLGLPF